MSPAYSSVAPDGPLVWCEDCGITVPTHHRARDAHTAHHARIDRLTEDVRLLMSWHQQLRAMSEDGEPVPLWATLHDAPRGPGL